MACYIMPMQAMNMTILYHTIRISFCITLQSHSLQTTSSFYLSVSLILQTMLTSLCNPSNQPLDYRNTEREREKEGGFPKTSIDVCVCILYCGKDILTRYMSLSLSLTICLRVSLCASVYFVSVRFDMRSTDFSLNPKHKSNGIYLNFYVQCAIGMHYFYVYCHVTQLKDNDLDNVNGFITYKHWREKMKHISKLHQFQWESICLSISLIANRWVSSFHIRFGAV